MAGSAPIKTFLPQGFWMHSVADRLTQPVQVKEDAHFDVMVIGGGFTGLSSALELAEAGKSVCIIEKDRVGSGASGFNCGHVGLNLGLGEKIISRVAGRDGPRRYADLLLRAVENVGRRIAESEMDCDYEALGNLTAAVHPSQHESLRQKYEAFHRAGFPVAWLDRDALDELGVPKFVSAAFHEQAGGCLHPVKYALALLSLARRADVAVFEQSPVYDLDLGSTIRARCAGGEITADSCVIATNAYSAELGIGASHYLPISVSVTVTDPLTDRQREQMDWASAVPMHTHHDVIENHRFTHDGRLLIGSKRVQFAYGTNIPQANNPDVFGALKQVLVERYPQMPDLSLAYGWTGRIAASSDTLPFVRRFRGDNIVFAAGYGGNGVPLGSYSGKLVAKLLLGQSLNEDAFMLNRLCLRVPTKILRYGVSSALFSRMQRKDDRIDEAVRSEQ